MPYTISKTKIGKYKLILDKTGKTLGIHPTYISALKQIRAVEINKKH
jgi:hypothetical protein